MRKMLLLTMLALAALGCQASPAPGPVADAPPAVDPRIADTLFSAWYIQGRTFQLSNDSSYDVEAISGIHEVYTGTWIDYPIGRAGRESGGGYVQDERLVGRIRLACDTPIPAGGKAIVECDGPIDQDTMAVLTGEVDGHYSFVIEDITYAEQDTE